MRSATETWVRVTGYPAYDVSESGEVRSWLRGGRNLRPRNIHGHLYVVLSNGRIAKNIAVHRLVAEAFVPNPFGKPEVNHINGIKADNRAVNLEWVTKRENMEHATRNFLYRGGDQHPLAKLCWAAVLSIRESAVAGATVSSLARKYGVDRRTVRNVIRKKTWVQPGED